MTRTTNHLIRLTAGVCLVPAAASAQTFAIDWSSIDGGGTISVVAGAYELGGTIGQHDAGLLTTGSLECLGGFWGVDAEVVAPCYANCDGSTAAPVLNALDFGCFLTKFAGADAYANCDGSTAAPILNALDFGCFLTKFAAGCT